jgi:crotonobetainyl-CoA:carnitine CoA-transferase CaiB-like acyl-CoA transferase
MLGRPELAEDERFRTFADRQRNAAELTGILATILRTRPREEWLEGLRAAAVPAGEVNSVAQALTDPQVVARDLIGLRCVGRWQGRGRLDR